jgi:hypothetical protein
MKRFYFAAGLFAAACLSLQAQTIDLRANIPFSFQVASVGMPAGEYTFHHSGDSLIVREEGGSHTAVLSLTNAKSRPKGAATGELQFNRYGEAYFLKELWMPYSLEGRVVFPSSRERELARRIHQAPAVVALQVK